jgi:hypothetical protein
VVVVAVSTAVVVSMGEVSAVALSMAVAFVATVSPVAVSTAVAFVAAVLVAATGVATGAITDSLMMSSSAAWAFRAGGAGAIRTDITVTAITRTITMDMADIHMVTMDTVVTRTAMDTAGTVTTVAPVMDIAMEADLTCAVASLNQVTQWIANTNHGVM